MKIRNVLIALALFAIAGTAFAATTPAPAASTASPAETPMKGDQAITPMSSPDANAQPAARPHPIAALHRMEHRAVRRMRHYRYTTCVRHRHGKCVQWSHRHYRHHTTMTRTHAVAAPAATPAPASTR